MNGQHNNKEGILFRHLLCCFIRMRLLGYKFITYNQILHTVHNRAVEKEMTTRL